MFFLRLYELIALQEGHVVAANYFNQGHYVGPGFLNAVNRYYGYRVWR